MAQEMKNAGQQALKASVLDTQLCTGCGACVGICPYAVSHNDRIILLHPCDLAEGRCYAYCPRTPTDLEELRKQFFPEEELTPELGSLKGFYITRATDRETRKGAQHGGTVSTLVSLALEEGLIDTAVMTEQGNDFLPYGVAVHDPADVKKRGKSKFIAAPTISEFNRIAKGNAARIGVVATPCQALALAKMRLKPIVSDDSHIDKLKLVVGLFCGWALSWRETVGLLRDKLDLDRITGMDIPPSQYHVLHVYTNEETIEIPLDEVNPLVREACLYCADMTAEFSDISVGSARLDKGWEEAKTWNQVIVRTRLGEELIELARAKSVLEFREIPEGNLERLKMASMNKKRTAVKNLSGKSGSPHDLIYLDSGDPVLRHLVD